MSKIDIDKFVASVYKRLLSQMGFIRMPNTDYSREFLKALDEALKDNGLKFWCDEIVEIEPKLSNLEQNGKNSKENIVPKFKKGDLVKVQYPSGIHTSIEGKLCRVVDVQDEHYIVKAPDGNKYQEPMSYQDYWTNIVSRKPANFAKSSKDLQDFSEFEQEFAEWYDSVTTGYPTPMTKEEFRAEANYVLGLAYRQFKKEQVDIDPEIQKIIDEHFDEMLGDEPNQELTEFEKAFITSYGAYAEGFNTIMKWRDYAKLTSKQLLDIAYKQFRKDQMNQEFATFTRQEFNKAVDEEIKRRCEGINVDEMFDEVPPRIFKTDFDFYKKGVVDTINKLKGE